MTAGSPLVFRPSLPQRTLAALLCTGSWFVGGRALALLLHHLPRLQWALRQAAVTGQPTAWHWAALALALLACLVAALVLLASTLGFLLVEGSQVFVDELGLSVEHMGIPGPLSRWLGSGRLTWKAVTALDKRRGFFVVTGAPQGTAPLGRPERIRFLVVDRLEELVLMILERSPNLRFHD